MILGSACCTWAVGAGAYHMLSLHELLHWTKHSVIKNNVIMLSVSLLGEDIKHWGCGPVR